MTDLNAIRPLGIDSTAVPLLLNSPQKDNIYHRHSPGHQTREESPKH